MPKNMDTEQDIDAIGYGQLPKETQFQKGSLGNPKGRPKGSKNLKTILLKELDTQISIQEKGRVRKVTKQEAFIKVLIANALKGDKYASQILVRIKNVTPIYGIYNVLIKHLWKISGNNRGF